MDVLGLFKDHESSFSKLNKLDIGFKKEKKGIEEVLQSHEEKMKILNDFVSRWDKTDFSKFINKFQELKNIAASDASIQKVEESIDLKMIGIIDEFMKRETLLSDLSEEEAIRKALEKLKKALMQWRTNLNGQKKALIDLQVHFDKLMLRKEPDDMPDREFFTPIIQLFELAKAESDILGVEHELFKELPSKIRRLRLLRTRRNGLPIGIKSPEELEAIGRLIADGLKAGERKFETRYNGQVNVQGTKAFIRGSRALGIVSEHGGEFSGKPPRKDADVDIVLVGDNLINSMIKFFSKRAEEGSKEMERLIDKVNRTGEIWNNSKHRTLSPPGFKYAEIGKIFEKNAGLTNGKVLVNVQMGRPDSSLGRIARHEGILVPLPL